MEPVDVEELYRAFEAAGLRYGSSFRTIAEAWRGDREAVVRLDLAPSAEPWERGLLTLHPALLDGAFQALALTGKEGGPRALVPFSVRRMTAAPPEVMTGSLCAVVRATETSAQGVVGDVRVMTASGQALVTVEGLSLRAAKAGEAAAARA